MSAGGANVSPWLYVLSYVENASRLGSPPQRAPLRAGRWPFAIGLALASVVAACAPVETAPPTLATSPERAPTENASDADPLAASFLHAKEWARAGYADTDEEFGPLQLGRGCHNCGRPLYKTAAADPRRFATALASADDPKLAAAVLMNVGREYGMVAALQITQLLDDHEPLWEAGMNAIAREVLVHYDSVSGGSQIAHEARRHARAVQTARARGAALAVWIEMTPPDPTLAKTLGYVPWETIVEWYGGPMALSDLDAFLRESKDGWVRADLYGRLFSTPGLSAALVSLVEEHANEETWIAKRGEENLHAAICERKDVVAQRALAKFFRARAASDPLSSDAMLASAYEASCKK